MNGNYAFGMPQYPGMPGESYSGNNPGFHFSFENYPQLMDAHQQLPPAPFNLFEDPYYQPAGLSAVPPHHAYPAGHPQMGQLPVQSQAQGASPSLFSPPPTAEYTPSNGSYPWGNTPPSASATPVPTSASPAALRSAPPSAAVPTHLTQQQQQQQPRTLTEDQQFGHEDLLELLDDFQSPATDNFYQPYPPHPHMPGFYSQHPMSSSGPMYAPTDPNSVPSPFPGSGDLGEYSPPSSLIKPPLSFDDDDDDSDLNPGDLEDFDLEDIDLPPGVKAGDLAVLKIPDLNKKLRDLGLNRDEQNIIKKMRRQHKNRHYAHTCRLKKVEKKNTMRSQKQVLESEIGDLKSDVEKLRRQRDEYKKNYETMQHRQREGQY